MTFTGCENAAKVACQNEGATPGVIRAFALEGRLGFIKTTTKAGTLIYAKAGWDLRPAGTETDVAIFECGDGLKEAVTQVSVAGSVIVPVTTDKMAVTSVLRYTATTGTQVPERFEGGAIDLPLMSTAGGAFETSGLTASQTVTNEEALETKGLP